MMALSPAGEGCVPAVKIDSRCELGHVSESGAIPALESGAHGPSRCEAAMLSAQCASASAWSIAPRDSSSAASGAPVSSGPPRTTAAIKAESRPPSGARPLASSGSEGPVLGPGPVSAISRTIELPAGADAVGWTGGAAGGVGAGGAGGGVVGSGSSSTTSPQPAPGEPVMATGGAVVAPASHAGGSAGSHPAAPAVHSSDGGGGSAGSVPSVGGALSRLRRVVRRRLRSGRRSLGLLRAGLGGLGGLRLSLRCSCFGCVAAAGRRVRGCRRDVRGRVPGSVLRSRRSAERERGGEHRHKGR